MNKYNFKNWTLGRFLRASDSFDLPTLLPRLTQGTAPRRILLWRIPKDLTEMTFGQRWGLVEAYKGGDLFFSTFELLAVGPRWWPKIPRRLLTLQRIGKLYPFVHFVLSDLERRARRDEALNVPLTAEQLEAGLGEMDHGLFGLIDTLVKRSSGYYSHADIDALPDNRVFSMLKVDVDNIIATRNLHQVMTAKK